MELVADKKGELNRQVGRAMRAHRVALGFSQESYAHHINLDRAYWASLERGERNLSLDNLESIAARMGVDPLSLLCDQH